MLQEEKRRERIENKWANQMKDEREIENRKEKFKKQKGIQD